VREIPILGIEDAERPVWLEFSERATRNSGVSLTFRCSPMGGETFIARERFVRRVSPGEFLKNSSETGGTWASKQIITRRFFRAAERLLVGLAEVEADVEFFLEKFGAAVGVHQVFGCVAVGGDAQADGATLEGRAQIRNALAVGVI